MAALARRLASLLITATVVLGLMAPSASAGGHENDALALLNADRAAAGLAPVAMHPDLVDDALAWSQRMMGAGALSHNPNLAAVTADWARLGENVGVGTSVGSLHTAFMNSPGHRGNILGDYDYVGIAVVEETSSKLWITVVFMKSLDKAPAGNETEEPEPYSDVQPAVDNDQPAATEPASRPVVVPAAEQYQPVAYVQSGVTPLPD